MSLRIINRSIVPTLAEVDILVVGAGSAGCVAEKAPMETTKLIGNTYPMVAPTEFLTEA
ncbi:MAG: hypothetical protein OSB19_03470 [Opitutaceae bacterium]|nr:hypothetical protein [Opitutaceae bacterium]